MLTLIVILGIWTLLSLPMSVILGSSISGRPDPELVGMDGDAAVYRFPNGRLERVPLTRTAA